MLMIFYILILVDVGRCSDHQIFDTKTVVVGQNVTLNCSRDHSWLSTNLFWIRLVSQAFPEILGATISHNAEIIETIHHITTKQEPGMFVLHINRAQLDDTAVYYCIKVTQRKMSFLKGTFLRIKGPETGITAVTQDFLSDLLHPGDPVTLQCSVLSNSEKNTCTEDHSVYWYRAKPDDTHTSLIYAHGNSGYDCEWSPEAPSQQKCVYSFSRNVSSSDIGTYYCAVATCGEIFFGNGTKLDVEVVPHWNLQKTNTVLFLLCVALSISLIVIAFLIYTIKQRSNTSAGVSLQTNIETTRTKQQIQQRGEDSVMYAAPNFTKRNARKAERRKSRATETICIYSDVRAFEYGKNEA